MKNIFYSLVIVASISGLKLFASNTKTYCQGDVAKSAEAALVTYGQKKAGAAALETDIFFIQGSQGILGVSPASKGPAKEFAVPYQIYQVQGFYRFSKKYFYVAMESYVEFGTCKVLKSIVTEELREYY